MVVTQCTTVRHLSRPADLAMSDARRNPDSTVGGQT